MMPDVGIVNGGGFYSKTKDRDMYYKKIGDKFMQYRLYPNFYQAKQKFMEVKGRVLTEKDGTVIFKNL